MGKYIYLKGKYYNKDNILYVEADKKNDFIRVTLIDGEYFDTIYKEEILKELGI